MNEKRLRYLSIIIGAALLIALSLIFAPTKTAWAQSGIVFTKTVGTDPAACASTDAITLPTEGGAVYYCYAVENNGSVMLTLHDVEDSELGTLQSGYHFSLTLGATFWFTEMTAITQTTINTATWTAYNAGPTDVVSGTDVATVTVPADLKLTKTVTPTTAVSPGQTVTYRLAFSNAGGTVARDVVLTDFIPISVTVSRVISSGLDITPTSTAPFYVWHVADMTPGAGGHITLTAILSPSLDVGMTLINSATITPTVADGDPTNNTAYAEVSTPGTDLVISKTVEPDPAIAGHSLWYTLTITNQGPNPALDVAITDTMPPSTTLYSVDQTDNGQGSLNFGNGTHLNTYWHAGRPHIQADDWLALEPPITHSGTYTSNLIDAYNQVDWTAIEWAPRRPYWKALPDDGQTETAYALGNANMTGNLLLLHLDQEHSTLYFFLDSSGLGHHGLCPADEASGESCPTLGAPGRFNGALDFDGTLSQTVVITEPTDPARYAIELWVRPAVITDTSFILRTDAVSGTAAHYSHLLGISDGHFLHYVNDGSPGNRAVIGTTPVQTDTWYHVVGTAQSGGDIKLYVNGREEGRLSGVGELWSGGDQYRLGSAYGVTGTTYFDGVLDEVAVYSRTLSASEITNHYLRGALRLSLQVRACASATCNGADFRGPGGLTTTFYSELNHVSPDTLPSATLTGTLGYRYFQYRATLETDDLDYSPELWRFAVRPSHRAVSATQGSCIAPTVRDFTCDLDTLDSGQTVTVSMRAQIDPSALGTITNSAVLTSASPDPDLENNQIALTSTVEAEVDLIILKHDEDWEGDPAWPEMGDHDPTNPGSTLTYTLRVRNAGPSTARNVTVSDTLPGELIGYASGGPGWICGVPSHTVTCTLDSLRPTYNWQELYDWEHIVITATAPITTGVITNTAWVTTTTPELVPGDNVITETTVITPVVDMIINKTGTPNPVNPGATLTYTIHITNAGPYPTATHVIVTDTLPSGLTGYAVEGDEWSCSTADDQIICELLRPLTRTLPSVTLNLTVTAPMSGFLVNDAYVTAAQADPDMENNYDTAYTPVRSVADLSIDKWDTPDPVNAGAPLTYTLTVTNAGPVDAGAFTTTLTAINGRGIHIPLLEGPAVPYHTDLYLSNVPGFIQDVTITLRALSHSYPSDMQILLVGPAGQRVVLLANAGGGTEVSDLWLVFNDTGTRATAPLTDGVVYRPTNNGLSSDLEPPAPGGPYGSSLSTFRGSSPNGRWQLYVFDSVYSDGGRIAQGWGLEVTAVTTDRVTLTDTLPAGLTGAQLDAPLDWDCETGDDPLRCTTDHFPVHAPAVFTITATAPITGGVITNTAGVTSTIADLDALSNTVSITTTVNPIADLVISKTAHAERVTMGDPLTYTLSISNAGPSVISGTITVTDRLPTGLTHLSVPPVVSSPNPSDTWRCMIGGPTGTLQLTCTLPNLAVGHAPDIVITATAPLTRGIIVNSARVTSTLPDPDLGNNDASVTINVTDAPIVGLVATNNSPTELGDATSLSASITAGDNVTYAWALGDGALELGNPISHTYPMTGTFVAVVTATNSAGALTATTTVQIVPVSHYPIYLPMVLSNYAVAPDLVVDRLIASSNAVTVTIKNQGDVAVTARQEDEFWVDVYIDPDTPPTQANQTWQHMGSQGMVWGVTAPALPLGPGEVFTLTLQDAYYQAGQSQVTWPLPAQTPVYAQVDSAHADTEYGAVLENHEMTGLMYNNVTSTTSTLNDQTKAEEPTGP